MILARTFFLRFLIVYFTLYIFPFPLNYVPFGIGETILDYTQAFWEWLTPVFARSVWDYTDEISFLGRGSGDTIYDYFLTTTRLALVLIAVLFWLISSKVNKYDLSILGVLIVVLRYYVAFTMFTYGFSKVFYLQFPELNLMNLTISYGDSSPMGLLWKFMGYSEEYSIVTGVTEVFGGGFLLFRRTKVLGGVITLGVMLHVFILNMCFDVPVKLFSFHLCIILLIILAPDLKNIVRFFVLNKPTSPLEINTYFLSRTKNLVSYVIKGLLLCYVLFTVVNGKLQSRKLFGKQLPKHELYGIYDIRHFVVNGDTLPPLTTDTLRWRRLIIDKRYSLVIKMDESRVGMRHQIDTLDTNSITLMPFLDENLKYLLVFKKNDTLLKINGFVGDDTLNITTSKRNREDFFLINRGFHWINEYPMQR